MIQFNKNDAILEQIAGILEKRAKNPLDLELVLDGSYDEFSGKFQKGKLLAGSYIQLLNMAGRVLRHPQLAEAEQDCRCHKELCGMFFCTHFKNYLDSAPLPELFDYIADLALWGMNTLMLWFDMHHFRNMEEGKAISDRLKKILLYCKSIGVKTVMQILVNEAFADSPEKLRADWTCGHDGYIYPLNSHYHVEICPSKEGGIAQILKDRREFLEVFRDVAPDYVDLFGYDQGGCSCSACAPWGSNGYVRTCEAIIPLFREYWPNTRFIGAMWQFGTFTGTNVEFIGLREEMNKGRLSELTYLLAEPQYAPYPYETGMPRPLIGFPEISMFGANPWGGYGANPLPKLMEDLWEQFGSRQEGGLPYSEGLYEDLNKVLTLRFYQDNQSAVDTVREYLTWEFGLEGALLEDVTHAIFDMEETLPRDHDVKVVGDHRYVIRHPEKAASIEETFRRADAALPEKIRSSKRWRQLYLRAVIDGEIVRNQFERSEKLMEYYWELVDIYHLHGNKFAHITPDIWDETQPAVTSHWQGDSV